jgi:hypothetical protein
MRKKLILMTIALACATTQGAWATGELTGKFSVSSTKQVLFSKGNLQAEILAASRKHISLFRHAIINSKQSHFLKTIRYKILSIPAYLEKKGNKNVLRLVRTMNQRQAFLGLWRTTENFDITRTNWA